MKRRVPSDKSPNRWWRRLASIAIIAQVWAILGRPLEFATQGPTGTSPAASAFYRPIKAYAEFTYLNHGYAFFAPNPGPSHLIRVTTEQADGGVEEAVYPDLTKQWPRLLYHRHFMLTEFLHNTFQPESLPPELAELDAMRARWELDRNRYQAIFDSMQSHLATTARVPQESVTVHRLEHQLLGLPEFLEDPRRMDDPGLLVDLTAFESEVLLEAEGSVPQMSWPTVPPSERPGPYGVPFETPVRPTGGGEQ